MLWTVIPFDLATREWAISWASTERKKSKALRTASPQRRMGLQLLWAALKVVARFQVIRKKMSNQLQSTRIWMPKSLPSLKPLRMGAS